MYTALIVLIVIASVLLIFFVLVQNSKGGGLSAGFSSSNQIMGVRKTTDFIEKTTWTLVAVVIFLSVATVAVNKSDSNNNQSQINQEELQKAQKAEPGVVAPGFGENPEATQPEAGQE